MGPPEERGRPWQEAALEQIGVGDGHNDSTRASALATSLPDLAQAIDREHEAAHAAARTALEHAPECGKLLLQAKEQVAHGQWLPWLEANPTVSARQSQRYMRLATATLEGKCDATSFLTIEG